MKAQSVISIIIIAGMVVALIGVAYAWAVPMIEKRTTIADYTLAEGFMLELDEKIVDIANTGSGDALLEIPSGSLKVYGRGLSGDINNTVVLDFFARQPLITPGGNIPIETSSLDHIGEYGKAEPRIIMLSGSGGSGNFHLNLSMRYRELRSSTNGYLIALCPSTSSGNCDGTTEGADEVRVYYDHSAVEPRGQLEGGDLKITYIGIEVY